MHPPACGKRGINSELRSEGKELGYDDRANGTRVLASNLHLILIMSSAPLTLSDV